MRIFIASGLSSCVLLEMIAGSGKGVYGKPLNPKLRVYLFFCGLVVCALIFPYSGINNSSV